MNSTVLDPLAVRVALRHLAALKNVDPYATAALDHRASPARVAREYQRREEGLVPVGAGEEDDEDSKDDRRATSSPESR